MTSLLSFMHLQIWSNFDFFGYSNSSLSCNICGLQAMKDLVATLSAVISVLCCMVLVFVCMPYPEKITPTVSCT